MFLPAHFLSCLESLNVLLKEGKVNIGSKARNEFCIMVTES